MGVYRREVPCTSSSPQTLVVHALTVPPGGIISVENSVGPTVPHLFSLEIRFQRGTFSFGHQDIDRIRAVVDDTLRLPASLAQLKVDLEGRRGPTFPALRDGKARALEDLRRLDDVLSPLLGLQTLTFVIPREDKQRYKFWRTTFQDCFVRLRDRGCLIDTLTYGALVSYDLKL